jgi:hypothetical protein
MGYTLNNTNRTMSYNIRRIDGADVGLCNEVHKMKVTCEPSFFPPEEVMAAFNLHPAQPNIITRSRYGKVYYFKYQERITLRTSHRYRNIITWTFSKENNKQECDVHQ